MTKLATIDAVEIGKLTVAVDALTKRQQSHEEVCTKRWTSAIILLIVNLLAVIGGMATLLVNAGHLPH